MASTKATKRNKFLLRNKEKGDMNQYWYSQATIEALAGEAERLKAKAAFISTPSLFFSIPKATRTKLGCVVLDYDKKWEKEDGFYFYDFNEPTEIAEELAHKFDLVVIDPPFITEDVWTKYAETAKLTATA